MSSYSDALNNLKPGQTISASGDTGGSSNYTISGGSSSSGSSSGSSSSGSSGADTSDADGFSVPEEFRTDENYGPTSTGSNGGSESPPDNGGYTNPPRPDRTEGGESTNISGGGDSNDPVSSGELDPGFQADEPVFSPSDPIVGIGEQVEEATGGSVSVNDFLDSVLKAGGSFSTGVGGTTEGQDLDSFNIPDELTQVPEVIPPITPEDFPTSNQPVSESGPSWLTFGVAAVVGIAGIAFARRSN